MKNKILYCFDSDQAVEIIKGELETEIVDIDNLSQTETNTLLQDIFTQGNNPITLESNDFKNIDSVLLNKSYIL